MAREHPETISPTAHYTGYVWFAHGQSHEAFATPQGKVMYHALHATTHLLGPQLSGTARQQAQSLVAQQHSELERLTGRAAH